MYCESSKSLDSCKKQEAGGRGLQDKPSNMRSILRTQTWKGEQLHRQRVCDNTHLLTDPLEGNGTHRTNSLMQLYGFLFHMYFCIQKIQSLPPKAAESKLELAKWLAGKDSGL